MITHACPTCGDHAGESGLQQVLHRLPGAVGVQAVHNALMFPLFDAATTPIGERTAYATGETGFAVALVNTAIALMVWRTARRKEDSTRHRR